MNFPEGQPEKKPESQEEAIRAALQRRRQYTEETSIPQLPSFSSWGERLLPILFAGMETCWVYAIFLGLASFDLFQSREPLMPLWAPFVLILGSYWISYRMELRAASKDTTASEKKSDAVHITTPGVSLLIALIVIVTLFIAWLSLYAGTAFLFDPTWLLSLLNDILLLNVHAYQVFSIAGLSVYFCWRGIRLSRRTIDASHIVNTLRLGLIVLIVLILVQAGQGDSGVVLRNELTLLLLIPIFLYLSLAAHALRRAIFVRNSHPVGLEGNIAFQEREILLMTGIVGLALLILTWLVNSIVSPTFLQATLHTLAPVGTALGIAYNWLVELIVRVATILLTPIFWFFSWFVGLFPHHAPKTTSQGPPPAPAVHIGVSNTSPAVLLSIKIILPILLLLLAIFLIRRALRRRRVRRVTVNRRSEEVHESLWSWSLFWSQLKSLWYALLRRFLPHRLKEVEEQNVMQQIEGEPAVRTIREIYRALLRKADLRGHPRKKYETPYEFQQRLDQQIPLIEPQLEEITSVYAVTRYSGVIPDESEVAHVRTLWNELNQKWG